MQCAAHRAGQKKARNGPEKRGVTGPLHTALLRGRARYGNKVHLSFQPCSLGGYKMADGRNKVDSLAIGGRNYNLTSLAGGSCKHRGVEGCGPLAPLPIRRGFLQAYLSSTHSTFTHRWGWKDANWKILPLSWRLVVWTPKKYARNRSQEVVYSTEHRADGSRVPLIIIGPPWGQDTNVQTQLAQNPVGTPHVRSIRGSGQEQD